MHSQGEAMGGPKRDGPNWVVIAGGAIVMAVGIVIGRKQIQSSHGEQQSRQRRSRKNAELFSPRADSKEYSSEGSRGVVYDSDSPGMKELFEDNFSPDGTSSQLSWKAPRATTYWDDSGTPVASQPQFELYSSKAKRPSPTKPSQPASKLCRQLKNDRDEFQSDSYSSPALRAGLAARREMVHKLRKQLRSRDGIIFDLQARISDQDQVITMHRVHTADLHERLKAANAELSKSNQEVQRLREELRIQSAKLHTVSIEERNGYDIFDGKVMSMSPDLKAVMLEARMLSEKVKRLQGEKKQMESQVQAFSRECELLFRKASALEAERVQLKNQLNEKGQFLEAKEEECMKLTTTLVNLQDNLDIETRDRDSDWARSSKVSRLSDALSENSRGAWSDGFDQPISCNTPDDYYSRSANTVDGNNRCAGDLMRSYNTLFRQSPSRLDSDGSVSKPGSRAIAHGCTSKSTCDGSPNYDGTDYDNDECISLSLVWSLQQEVYQLSDALASRSKAVSQRKVETNRVLTEFQATQTASLCGPEEYDWEDLSQVLSFSPDGTSAEQLQELSHKLEKVAKQQQVEDEIEALCRHQDQITALRSRLTKLTAKCNSENITLDELSNDSVHAVTGMLLDLADKLDVQEDQVRETTMDIQQLSMSLQLSSPYVPRSKKQELQRMLQEGSRQSDCRVFERMHHKDIPISPDQLPSAKPSYSTQELNLSGRSSRSLDRQISFSTLPNKADVLTPSSEEPPNKLYEFQVGAFDPLPSAKIRKSGSNAGARKSSQVQNPKCVHQSTGIGLKWDAASIEEPSVQARTRRVCFSPEEVTSGFSFHPLPTKADCQSEFASWSPDMLLGCEEGDDNARVAGHFDSGWVVDSDDFQWRQEVHEGLDEATSTGVPAYSSYSQTNSTSHSQSAPSSHKLFGRSSGISQSSYGKSSSAVGAGSAPPSCSESRDSLRRFLFKPDNGTRNSSLYDGDDSYEDTTVALEKLCLTAERKNGFVTDDGNNAVQIKEEDSQPSILVKSARTKQEIMQGFVGVSPFAARMAGLDVKRSTSSLSSPQDSEVGNQGASLLFQEADEDASHAIGKENIMRSNELFYSGSQALLSRSISSKNTWDDGRSMATRDIFRCDRGRWNSFH